MTEDRWEELNTPRTFTFSDRSLYRSLHVGDRQYDKIQEYENRYKIPVHYLLYNPTSIPWSVTFPISNGDPPASDCSVGCRVVPSSKMRHAIVSLRIERPPSYGDLVSGLGAPFDNAETIGGWSLESYIIDQLLACKDGLVDETPHFDHLHHIFSQKSQPIHSAITITFDLP